MTVAVPAVSLKQVNEVVKLAKADGRLFPGLTFGRTRPATILRMAVVRGMEAIHQEALETVKPSTLERLRMRKEE